MSTEVVGRSIIRQGFIVLFGAFLLGFGIIPGGPRARGFMSAHITAMIGAALIILVGLVADRLVLTSRQRKVLRFSAILDGYWGLATGLYATIFNIPGPVTGAGAKPAGLAATVFFIAFIPVITILPFIFTGLTIYGLRASPAEPSAAAGSSDTR